MPRITQPLRDEHKELLPHIEALRVAADCVGTAPIADIRSEVDAAYAFLDGHLIPHAKAEEAALYPTVARLMGAREATATMIREHVEIGRMVGELGVLRGRLGGETLTPVTASYLRHVLYGLHALVKMHFFNEEEVFLPLLDARLDEAEAREMFARMERVAHEAMAGAR